MIVRGLALVLIVAGVILPTAVGLSQPGYSMVSQYLSELGAAGAPNAALVNYGGFLPTGLAFALLMAVLHPRLPGGAAPRIALALMALVGVSYVGAVFAPCEAGCPAQGGPSQTMHNLLGLIGYAGPIAGLVLLAAALRTQAPGLALATLATAVLFTGGFLVMTTPEAAGIRGAAQRLADFSLFAWAAALAFRPGARARPARA